MKRKLPLALVFILAIWGILSYFVFEKHVQTADELYRNKFLVIIAAFAIILGIGSLIQYHINKIKHKQRYWPYSIVTLLSLVVSSLIGIFGGPSGQEGWFSPAVGSFRFDIQQLYEGIIVPCGSTMFSLLAFFMSSAAYRAFRARNMHAIMLLSAAFIVMIGQIPLTNTWIPWVFEIRQWILDVPNLAAKRGILIGIGLGSIATSLKIILGIERSWLGGGD